MTPVAPRVVNEGTSTGVVLCSTEKHWTSTL